MNAPRFPRSAMNLFRCTVIVMLCARLFAADPATSSLSARGIGELDAVMKHYSETDRFPGVMLMVARDGKVAYWKAFGVRAP